MRSPFIWPCPMAARSLSTTRPRRMNASPTRPSPSTMPSSGAAPPAGAGPPHASQLRMRGERMKKRRRITDEDVAGRPHDLAGEGLLPGRQGARVRRQGSGEHRTRAPIPPTTWMLRYLRTIAMTGGRGTGFGHRRSLRDEQIDLWRSRGWPRRYTVADWGAVRADAEEAHNTQAALSPRHAAPRRLPRGRPALLGRSCEEYEIGRL